MTKIPQAVLDRQRVLEGLVPRHHGKVRDSYELPGHPDLMLVVASDRCSIFDFVLPTFIDFKGEILNALNHFWTTTVLKDICETDFVACGVGIDEYLPEHLQGNVDLQKRATVVKIMPAPEVEDIIRIHLTGSGWSSYLETGAVCGHRLPKGLKNGSKLPYPIYTPTTKAEEGHDVHLDVDDVVARFGSLRERRAIQCALAIAEFAASCGVILADTKFEMSVDAGGNLVLVDEKGTPDSSRYWGKSAWEKAMREGKLPPPFDKQLVRDWGKTHGIDKRQPENPEDVAFVHSLEVPDDVRQMTTRIYRYIFWLLTGMKIETYQRCRMGIAVPDWRPRVEILLGSRSDLPQIIQGIYFLKASGADVRVTVISCHRNVGELPEFVRSELTKADIAIAGAGMAAALPGVVKSLLCLYDRPDIPVIGVAFKGLTEEDNDAAMLSIECLPGQPVELDQNGHAYWGPDGFTAACHAAIKDEFLPKTIARKPVETVPVFP